jgi:hypothetical protein
MAMLTTISNQFMGDNIAITLVAVLSVIAARYLWLSTQPPPSQANIPKTSIIKRWLFVLRNEGHEQQYARHLKPLVDRAGIAQINDGHDIPSMIVNLTLFKYVLALYG